MKVDGVKVLTKAYLNGELIFERRHDSPTYIDLKYLIADSDYTIEIHKGTDTLTSSFRTLVKTDPKLSNFSVTKLTHNSATINWSDSGIHDGFVKIWLNGSILDPSEIKGRKSWELTGLQRHRIYRITIRKYIRHAQVDNKGAYVF